MIIRLGFLVAASVAAYAVTQININCSRRQTSVIEDSENGDTSFEKHQNEREEKEHLSNSNYTHEKKQESRKGFYPLQMDDEEEVKRTRSITNPTLNNFHTEEPSLPEHRDHSFRKVRFSTLDNKLEVKGDSEVENDNLAYETETANYMTEMERFCDLLKELEKREVKLERKLLKFYSMKEEESYIAELHRHLKIKTVEIDMLNTTINSFEAERKKLQEEIKQVNFAKKQLAIANTKIKDLHRQMHISANTTKGQLLMLRQQVSGLQTEEASKRDTKVEKKLKVVKELELEVVKLKRMNKELQLERRELEIKLVAAEDTITALSNMTEGKMVAKVKEEVSSLRQANEDLLNQVERLQKNRFSIVEELVYQRWVNVLLSYENQIHQTPSGKTSACDSRKSLRPELSISSHTSSAVSEEFNSTTISSSSSRQSCINKKTSLVQKIKRWRRSMDDSSDVSLRGRSFEGSSRSGTSLSRRASMSEVPSEVMMSKKAGDSTTITTSLVQKIKRWRSSMDDSSAVSLRGKSFEGSSRSGTSWRRRPSMSEVPSEVMMSKKAGDSKTITRSGKEQDFTDSLKTPNFPRKRRVSFSDSVSTMGASTQNISKSIEGVSDKKYPMYKDQRELALDRENEIKEKGKQTRVERLSDSLNLNGCSNSKASLEGEKPNSSPLELSHVKKVVGSSDSIEQPTDNSKAETQVVSNIKTAHTEEWDSTMPSVPPNGKNMADTQMGHFVAVFFFLLLMFLVYFLLLTAGVY